MILLLIFLGVTILTLSVVCYLLSKVIEKKRVAYNSCLRSLERMYEAEIRAAKNREETAVKNEKIKSDDLKKLLDQRTTEILNLKEALRKKSHPDEFREYGRDNNR